MKVEGKVALVTGGVRGFGKGFAEALLQAGAQVCLLDVDVKAGLDVSRDFTETYGPGSSMFIQCDVTSNPDMADAFRKVKLLYGNIDIVVNNAGIGREDLWEQMIMINLVGVMRGTRLALDYMKASNGGRGGLIINVASVAGLMPIFMTPNYSASKFGCVGYSRSMGRAVKMDPELKGIRISCIAPSYAETDMFGKIQAPPKHAGTFTKATQTMGIMQVSDVVRGFMALVEDDRADGGVLEVTPNGAIYVHPEKLKGSKL